MTRVRSNCSETTGPSWEVSSTSSRASLTKCERRGHHQAGLIVTFRYLLPSTHHVRRNECTALTGSQLKWKSCRSRSRLYHYRRQGSSTLFLKIFAAANDRHTEGRSPAIHRVK